MKKDEGLVENLTGMIPVLAALLFMVVFVQLGVNQAAASMIEDALAASNLASAVISVEEYGISRCLAVEDPEKSFQIYRRALADNLGLDDTWVCRNSSMISGKVTVYEYSIYEVTGTDVVWYCFPQTGGMERKEFPGGAGTVKAADGTLIQSTSVYSRIGFPVNCLGREIYCYKEKCVDIVGN